MSSYEAINMTIGDDVATIQFNRPEKKNCMSPTLHSNMRHALQKVEAAKVKVLVITGVKDAFCAGMDLEKCFLEPFDDPARMEEINTDVFAWFVHLKKFSAVTIAKVNGWCFGGGMLVAGLCDICIAAEESVWGLSEVNFGIIPGGGTTWAYAHNIPARKQALYSALTGDTFTGKEGVALGFVTKSVPHAELDSATQQVIDKLTNKGRGVLRKIKQVYERSVGMDFEESLEWEMAKAWELSYETGDDWVRTALTSFSKREYKPGTQAYKLTKKV